ncbi:hypothetical protein A2276_04945 [candidate division WOR-1 bacterium RIFOXYA12_FULL_43_27]|uniref:Glucose-6-phosphate isomerase n=1 Tax=candidate division WOR-1 bacterium RIFOXYC2_FULL_46_14 TaxID=1802587 RepID=A0A1F4U882_UNCSA|nr:MAG: hypothetical protein A2276_04945 [candidate division WOR-1 bacterium RIFOXYA12_FULL_43_27]OGC20013.1 MAG: hypothetical protein A2292_02950 [candidate division WOR-1 bacterium RIFOXYB2_FULL_46_45]OGC32250.1 MAG: hypothetical protein A2232_08495 [candidate division WOR-1 bacterium RIFOXYA2_FULL_46_56]OGC41154.1 MAG: hypothetical protein A2438_07435 [candidate division WOR-1 bacterium RIFOXYC2_FULL_46_14]
MAGLRIPAGVIARTGGPISKTKIVLDYRRFGSPGSHITEDTAFKKIADEMPRFQDKLLNDNADPNIQDGGIPMVGWKREAPYRSEAELRDITAAANALREISDDIWMDGIGGSYLGGRAMIEAVKGNLEQTNAMSREERGGPRLWFIGNNMDPRAMARQLQLMKGRQVAGSVYSKSGTTMEPAIAFAIIKAAMDESYSAEEIASRIVALTDKSKGALLEFANKLGLKRFVVPDNIGGRYSVLTDAGLFVLALGGLDIISFVAGAKDGEEATRNNSLESNPAFLRATMRAVAMTNWGKAIEVYATGMQDLWAAAKEAQQVFPETEGKKGLGLWVTPELYTEMAHANGQMIQEGPRIFIETFLKVEDPGVDVLIPAKGTPVEFVDGKSLHLVNNAFIDGLESAHYQGGVPTMSYLLPELSEYVMAKWYQLERNVAALSSLATKVQNPFIQPGVVAYKNAAMALLKNPATEQDDGANLQFRAAV